MFNRSLLTLLCVFFISASVSSQTTEIWPQYYIQVPVAKKLFLSTDFSHRYDGAFKNKVQWISRLGFGYKITAQLTLGVGHAYSEFFSASGVRRENRPWQQLQSDFSVGNIKLMQRLRLEERFQKDQSLERFNYRVRFQFQVTIPVLPEQKLSLQLSDEPMINFGREISGNHFDQNRLQGGFQIKVVKNVFLMPSYVYLHQYQPSRKSFRNVNVFRTGLAYRRL
jgi:hypothetical protein